MFLNGGFFWLLMGVVLFLVAAGFRAFAEDRGWRLTWWKWILALLWYGLLCTVVYAFGTLTGENEGTAALRLLLFGLFLCTVLGAGLRRLMAHKPRTVDNSKSDGTS